MTGQIIDADPAAAQPAPPATGPKVTLLVLRIVVVLTSVLIFV